MERFTIYNYNNYNLILSTSHEVSNYMINQIISLNSRSAVRIDNIFFNAHIVLPTIDRKHSFTLQ